MKKTQTERVLERLRVGPLTQMEALTELGVMRLGARILELREAHTITTEMVEVPTRIAGQTATVARYTLRDCDAGHDFRPINETWGEHKCSRCGLITAPEFKLTA